MPTWRVRVEDVSDRLAPAAAPPNSPTPFTSKGGLVRFAAAPGTVNIPAPEPAGIPGAISTADRRGGGNTPPVTRPRLDVPFADNMQPPVRWVSTNEIPIPAGNTVRLPQIASRKPARLGGRHVIPSVRAFTRWPSAVAGVPSDN